MSNLKSSLFQASSCALLLCVLPGGVLGATRPTVAQQGPRQNQRVSGIVVDQSGEPIIGANVSVKGTSKGTVTDREGRFMLDVNPDEVIQVSFVGYLSENFTYRNQRNLQIRLQEDTQALDEVVVVGYGTQKKSNLTGSITSVKADDLFNLPAKTVAEALQGKAAGVYVNKGAGVGATSDIFIRGVGSVSGMSPLYIIDGVPSDNDLGINFNDIESIEVIKDASAAAIYGANAAGGVILVTTKRGEKGKPKINVSLQTGITHPSTDLKLLSTADYIVARSEATGDWYDPWDDVSSLPDTDWADVMGMRDSGLNHKYTASLSGADDRFNYYLSGQYQRQDGTQEDFWEYFSGLLKVEYNAAKNLKIGTRIEASKTNQNDNYLGWQTIMRSVPWMTIYDDDGSYTHVPSILSSFSGDNYVANSDRINHDENGITTLDANVYLDWQIIDGLNFNITGIVGHSSEYLDDYDEASTTKINNTTDSYTKSTYDSESYRFYTTLTYDKVFAKKHAINVMIGWEAGKSKTNTLSATAYDLSVTDPKSFYMATSTSYTASGVLDTNGRVISQFGRLNYAYDDKYLLTFNIRRDGSTKFGPSHRFGIFPSVSVGWKISEESFFKSLGWDWVTLAKPRFSWGILGNTDALDEYTYQKAYSQAGVYSFDGSTWTSGYTNLKVTNEDLKWEEIHTLDVGLDLSLFDNRLEFMFDWYKRDSKDMLYNLSMPQSSGISALSSTSTMAINIGSIVNKGVEFSLGWRDHISDFFYAVSVNIAHNSNKVVNLGTETAYIYDGDSSSMGYSNFKTVNGQSVGMLWGLKTDGIITSQDQIDALNAEAQANGYDYYYDELTGVGDLKYIDLNGDGHIDLDDCTFIGNPWPKVQYGGNITLGYKNVDFSASFAGVAGRDVYNTLFTYMYTFEGDWTTTYNIFKTSYFNGNGLTEYPRVYAIDSSGNTNRDPNYNYSNLSDYIVEDGSYFKLKTLTIGYTLPKKWLKKIHLDNLRIYFSGDNLFTITGFSGLDPEFSASITSYGASSNWQAQSRIYTFGIDFGF